jgi:hypothetical protein
MTNKKKKPVPNSCQMGAPMTDAMYIIEELLMYNGIDHYTIFVKNIIAIIVYDDYVLFRMSGEEDIKQKKNIGHYRLLLSCTQFGKYGKSCILNKHFVKKLGEGSELVASMFNGDIYKVSEDNNVRIKQDMKPIFAARLRKLKLIIISFIS